MRDRKSGRPKGSGKRVRTRIRVPGVPPILIEGPSAPLSIHFDETRTIMYVRMSHADIASTKELPDEVLADYDGEGNLVGFEVIGYQNGRAGWILSSLRRKFPEAAPAIDQLRELVPA